MSSARQRRSVVTMRSHSFDRLTFASGGFVATGSMGPSIADLTVADGTGLNHYACFPPVHKHLPEYQRNRSIASIARDSVSIVGRGVLIVA